MKTSHKVGAGLLAVGLAVPGCALAEQDTQPTTTAFGYDSSPKDYGVADCYRDPNNSLSSTTDSGTWIGRTFTYGLALPEAGPEGRARLSGGVTVRTLGKHTFLLATSDREATTSVDLQSGPYTTIIPGELGKYAGRFTMSMDGDMTTFSLNCLPESGFVGNVTTTSPTTSTQ